MTKTAIQKDWMAVIVIFKVDVNLIRTHPK